MEFFFMRFRSQAFNSSVSKLNWTHRYLRSYNNLNTKFQETDREYQYTQKSRSKIAQQSWRGRSES